MTDQQFSPLVLTPHYQEGANFQGLVHNSEIISDNVFTLLLYAIFIG